MGRPSISRPGTPRGTTPGSSPGSSPRATRVAVGAAAAAAGAGTGAPAPARPPMFALVEEFPDLFKKEVLERLDPVDLALLGRTGARHAPQ